MSYAVKLTTDAEANLRSLTLSVDMYKFIRRELVRLADDPQFHAEYNTFGNGVFKTYGRFGNNLHSHLFEVYFFRNDATKLLVVDRVVVTQVPGPH